MSSPNYDYAARNNLGAGRSPRSFDMSAAVADVDLLTAGPIGSPARFLQVAAEGTVIIEDENGVEVDLGEGAAWPVGSILPYLASTLKLASTATVIAAW